MPTDPQHLADEARHWQQQALRGFVLQACLSACDPACVADEVARLRATDEGLADALFYACASDATYLPFYGDVADVVCRLRGPGAARAILHAAAVMGAHPKKHAASLVADLAMRGVVRPVDGELDPTSPVARKLAARGLLAPA